MRRDLALVLFFGILPSLVLANERPVSRDSETQIQQVNPKLRVRPEAPAREPNAADAVSQPSGSTRCTPENATSPECATAATQGGGNR
jgi:hypothetical protein